MSFISRNKYHVVGCGIITLLFLLSIYVRQENLTVPLSRHHEWITAHTLITCQIWEENGGPSAYNFSPVYTYPGKGNRLRRRFGGVLDPEGNAYYVSYPPFAFLFAYYSMKLTGGSSVDSIRNLNLSIHYLCCILLYLIAVALANEEKKKHLSIAGLVGAFLYLFSAGNLWFHGNLYFADVLVQLFIIASIYITLLFFKKRYHNELIILSLLFFIFFLATYTEWLGLFFAFFVGFGFLTVFFIKRESRFIKAFFTVGVASAMALALTLFQYSSIAGWESFKEVSEIKYAERSGHESAADTPGEFNLESQAAFDFMIDKINKGYKMPENFVGIFFGLFLIMLIYKKVKRKKIVPTWHWIIFLLYLSAVLLHYYLFYNFNSLHDFSSLKTGLLLILLVIVLISLIEHALKFYLTIGLALLSILLAIDKGIESVRVYKETTPLSEVEWYRLDAAEIVRQYSHPDVGVYINLSNNPELIYYAKHNVCPIIDTFEIKPMMGYYGNSEGQYYHLVDQKVESILEFHLENDSMIFTNKIMLNTYEKSEGPHFQK